MTRRALALAAAVAALALAGCAPGIFDPTDAEPADVAPWIGGTPSSEPAPTEAPEPTAGASAEPDAGTPGGTADPQPTEVEGVAPAVPPAAVDDGPAILERSGRLVLALDARTGCEPLLGRVVQEPAAWTIQMLTQPESACTGGSAVATYELPGGDRPERVVVDLGGQRTEINLP